MTLLNAKPDENKPLCDETPTSDNESPVIPFGVITIGGIAWRIVIDPCLDSEGLNGDISEDKALIRIMPRDPSAMTITLVHEILHAINWVYCNSDIPHKVFNALSHGLIQSAKQLMPGCIIEWPDKIQKS
ncbi:hypothetical protein [Dehalococcoides mccartyi]|uniref:hypothetical protein n=1 Tax=Dehalococcoides mccartyi TaxID=61435 RepID=UPI0008053CDA|nr:hypothetical protein [Dehalococcoides mccartyi]OBW62024.1 MAG: hypothetical protein A9181_03400 [Dehalococcoides mccartyi]BEL00753.1 hypothetical protein DMOBY_06060 [Dehalococcoides mccartyi]